MRRTSDASTMALLHGAFYVASGLWPIVHMRSFEAVTGKKRDRWLVRTVGLLLVTIGGVLASAGRRRRVTREVVLLGAGSAASLAAIDLAYGIPGVISRVYLADAALQLGVTAGWAATGER